MRLKGVDSPPTDLREQGTSVTVLGFGLSEVQQDSI